MRDDDWMAKHVIVGLVTDPGSRVPPKDKDYYRVHWRGASMDDTPAFMDYGAADLALEHRNRVRAGGGTAEVYRRNRATGLDERLP